MIIVVSGTRSADPRRHQGIIATALAETAAGVNDVTVRHGGGRGVDAIAATIAASYGWGTDPHPAQWNTCAEGCPPSSHLRTRRGYTWCPYAGPRRNAAMLAALPAPDRILAFPATGTSGKGGTWDLIHRATDAGHAIHRIQPLRIGGRP